MISNHNQFPMEALPSAIESAVADVSAGYGVEPGGVAMAFLAIFGAALGGRVRVAFGTREHGLNLPVALVCTPTDESTEYLEQLASAFTQQMHRLDKLAAACPGYIEELRSARKLLNHEPPGIPLGKPEVEQITKRMNELETYEAHDFVVCDAPGGPTAVFDGNQLYYARDAGFITGYLAGKSGVRERIATELFRGFFTRQPIRDQLRLSVLTVATRGLTDATIKAWRGGASGWPMVFVDYSGGMRASIESGKVGAAVKTLRSLIKDQLQLRIESNGLVLGPGEFGIPAANEFDTELQSMSREILLPQAYSHFGSVLVRLAGILHLLDGDGQAVIGERSWRRAGQITSWLLRQQHGFVDGAPALEPDATIAPAKPCKKYPAPTARDHHFFTSNLARCQPTTWHALRPRLPKRSPAYWARFKEAAILSGHVVERAGLLTLTPAKAAV